MTLAAARILSVLGALERQFALTDLEKEERAIVYFVVDRLASGREVRLADVASAGVCTRPSAYRHVRSLVRKDVLRLDGDTRLTIALAPRLARFERAFETAITKMPVVTKSKAPSARR